MTARPPASRKNDPSTSREAEADLNNSGRRETDQRRAAEAVRKYPGLPSSELARRAQLDRHMLGRRLGEIEAGAGPGRILRVGVGKDTVTKRNGGLWYTVELGCAHLAESVREGTRSMADIDNDFGTWVAKRVRALLADEEGDVQSEVEQLAEAVREARASVDTVRDEHGEAIARRVEAAVEGSG